MRHKNYLENIPVKNPGISWSVDNEAVTLEVKNKGILQKVLKKPKICYVHLDETGSFVWPLIDGKNDIIKIGAYVKEHFGERAEPLYERLAQYFKILESYGFVNYRL